MKTINHTDRTTQRKKILSACRRHGWSAIETIDQLLLMLLEKQRVYSREPKRPALQLARQALQGGQANTLVIAKHEASTPELAAIMATVQRQCWALVALDYLTADDGTATVIATLEQFERRFISERTRQALELRRAQGVKLGRPHRVPQSIIDRIITERETGATYRTIAQGLNDDGIPTAHGGRQWYPGTVRYVFMAETSGTDLKSDEGGRP